MSDISQVFVKSEFSSEKDLKQMPELQKMIQIQDIQDSSCSQQVFLKCRTHTSKYVKHLCLDQNCDHQRMMCSDCENTDHYNRHRNKCILLSELMSKSDFNLEMKNWPQDSYLRCFQDYLKGQTNQYESSIIQMCKGLLKFMQEKMEELAQTMLNLCSEEQRRNQDKNSKLMNSYIEECSNLDQIRELMIQLNNESNEQSYKYYQQQNEKKMTQIVNDLLIHHTQYKQYLNQQFGFGYFEGKQASKSLLDFNLIQQEFDSIKQSLSQMCTFIEKNATINKSLNSPRTSASLSAPNYPSSGTIDSIGSTESNSFSSGNSNGNAYDLYLTTLESEVNKIIFRTDEKSAIVKKISKPTFFFSNIIPQQCYFQIRLTGVVKCGTYIGLIDDQQKQIKITPQTQQNHFLGFCLACPQEIYGNCKIKGPGLDFNPPPKEEYEYEEDQYQDENNDNEPEVQTLILNIFINLTKKLISISDITSQKYLKFDLDDKNYFYNREMRLFVQSQEQIKFEVLQYSKV